MIYVEIHLLIFSPTHKAFQWLCYERIYIQKYMNLNSVNTVDVLKRIINPLSASPTKWSTRSNNSSAVAD